MTLIPVLSEFLVRLLDWSSVLIKRITRKNSNIRHVVFVNWNGKYGDAIVSAPIIQFFRDRKSTRLNSSH